MLLSILVPRTGRQAHNHLKQNNVSRTCSGDVLSRLTRGRYTDAFKHIGAKSDRYYTQQISSMQKQSVLSGDSRYEVPGVSSPNQKFQLASPLLMFSSKFAENHVLGVELCSNQAQHATST